MTTKITIPSGREMTADQYLELVARMQVAFPKRDPWLCGAALCANGHDGCAAWAGGPCSAEVEDSLEDARHTSGEGDRR